MPQIVLNDENVNRYGFRVLTSGIDTAMFAKNPVLLYNHRRSSEYTEQTILPLGKWNNVRKEGGMLIGEPELDSQDEMAVALANKLESGYLNAASIGIKVIEWSEDPTLMLPGQTQPTVTKCELQEVSLVDIPANPNCVRMSYKGETVELSATANPDLKRIFHKTIVKMDATTLKNLGLPENATPEQIAEAVANLKAASDSAAATVQEQKDQAAKALVEGAKQAGKITATQEEHFLKFARVDYDAAKAALDSMVVHTPISAQLANAVSTGVVVAEVSKHLPEPVRKYDDMAKAGTLVALKAQDPAEFNRLQEAKVKYEREILTFKGLLKNA